MAATDNNLIMDIWARWSLCRLVAQHPQNLTWQRLIQIKEAAGIST